MKHKGKRRETWQGKFFCDRYSMPKKVHFLGLAGYGVAYHPQTPEAKAAAEASRAEYRLNNAALLREIAEEARALKAFQTKRRRRSSKLECNDKPTRKNKNKRKNKLLRRHDNKGRHRAKSIRKHKSTSQRRRKHKH